jgi:glycosyltransferase involved in cell wall biosynthesis
VARRSMRRVALLAASGQLGGAERMVLESARAWTAMGWSPAVVALEDGPLVVAARGLGLDALALPPPRGLARLGDGGGSRAATLVSLASAALPLPAYVRRLARVLDDWGTDVVHSHGIKTHVLSTLLPRRRRVIWHLHDYVGARPLSAAILSRLAHRADLLIAVSQSVAADTRTWLRQGPPIAAVLNAVDTERFAPGGSVADLDTMAGLPLAPSGTVRIGLPATFATWKGHDEFLQAAASTPSTVRAYVIGGPVYRTRDSQWSADLLRRRIAALGLAGRAGLTGVVDDMPAVYRALDVVVHASTRPEPFGLVIVEAMACGRFVLATRTGGAAELFEPGVAGGAIDTASAATLGTALRQWLADPAGRAAIAGRARAHVVGHFSRPIFAEALARAVAPVLGGPVQAGAGA